MQNPWFEGFSLFLEQMSIGSTSAFFVFCTRSSGAVVTYTASGADAGAAGNDVALGFGTDKGSGFNNTMQIGANASQSFSVNTGDMRAEALSVTGRTAKDTITAKDGKEATLTAIRTVSNGTTSNPTEYSLDVTTHDKATAAISVIDDAINEVSSERPKLGVMQNRLEHTISNLGTSAENLTAAESRIRDVDMAAEMMEFTKNNIL